MTELELQEQIARIRRSQVETSKFVAEQNKFAAEAANLGIARFVTPIAAVIAAIGSLIAAAPVVFRLFNNH